VEINAMTGWDVLSSIIKEFPPMAAVLVLIAAGVIFVIGFAKHGLNFVKYGFQQAALDVSLESRFDDLDAKFDTKFNTLDAKFDTKFNELDAKFDAKFNILDAKFNVLDAKVDGLRGDLKEDIAVLRGDFNKMETELATIKVNHFGHLKNFLTELTSILVDKGVFNNENKARLDNHLRGM
jgi:hypothetical protein